MPWEAYCHFDKELQKLVPDKAKYAWKGNLDDDMIHTGVIFDSYVDRTFHWARRALEACGRLPYVTPWMGVIHHTFDTTYSDYNCENLFLNPTFLDSLSCCRALITLSRSLGVQIERGLKSVGRGNIPVITLTHPTESCDKNFNLRNFASNSDKRLVNIGAWLRKPYTIYEINLPPITDSVYNPLGLKKSILKGSSMGNCFEPDGMLAYIEHIAFEYASMAGLHCNETACFMSRGCHCSKLTLQTGWKGNKFVAGLVDVLERNKDSVHIIQGLDNDAYDELLSQNLVFLNLVDASAVNTAIECAVRNTPLIVNRLPALEELFGNKYPGFYDDVSQVPIMLADPAFVQKTYMYLSNMDKTQLSLRTFVTQLNGALAVVAK